MDPWLLYYLLLLEVIGVSDLFLGKRLLSLLRTHRDQPFNDNCTPLPGPSRTQILYPWILS